MFQEKIEEEFSEAIRKLKDKSAWKSWDVGDSVEERYKKVCDASTDEIVRFYFKAN